MDEMKEFTLWFLQTVPDILLEPPISAFTGMALLCFVVGVIRKMITIR